MVCHGCSVISADKRPYKRADDVIRQLYDFLDGPIEIHVLRMGAEESEAVKEVMDCPFVAERFHRAVLKDDALRIHLLNPLKQWLESVLPVLVTILNMDVVVGDDNIVHITCGFSRRRFHPARR